MNKQDSIQKKNWDVVTMKRIVKFDPWHDQAMKAVETLDNVFLASPEQTEESVAEQDGSSRLMKEVVADIHYIIVAVENRRIRRLIFEIRWKSFMSTVKGQRFCLVPWDIRSSVYGRLLRWRCEG